MVSVNGIPQAWSPQDLGRRVRDLERKLEQQTSARNLRNSSVDGTLTIQGILAVDGVLTVPPGSISNESLQNPVEDGSASASVTNIAVTPTTGNAVIAPLTVPEGFTRALIIAHGSVNVANAGTVADTVTALCWIDTTSGQSLYAQVPAGGSAALSTMAQSEAIGLTGGQIIVCALELRTATASFPAAAGTTASISASAIFRR